MRAKQGLLKGLNPTVTLWSLSIVMAFVAFCATYGVEAAGVFKTASDAILDNFKWFYLALVSGVLGVLIVIGFSRYGSLKLGRPEENRSSASLPGSPCFSAPGWVLV
jgi:Choline-glycine betaine transporter